MSIWTKRIKEEESEDGAGFLLPDGFLVEPFLVGGSGLVIWFKRTKETDTE